MRTILQRDYRAGVVAGLLGLLSSAALAAPNAAPTVSLTAPASGTVVAAPGPLTLTATASDADGSIARVEFYQGATLLGSATSAPYSLPWNNVAAGTYSLTARATDNKNKSTTSAPVTVIVDTPPTVSLSSPAAGSSYVAPATISLAASAADADGSVAQVAFFANGSLVGTATTVPYGVTWNAAVPGNYSLTAVAIDDRGIATTSAARSITVAANLLPSVSLTSPAANQVVAAPGNLTLTANANDVDGNVTRVDFYAGPAHLGTSTTAPYSVPWNNVPAGSYTLTAVASDDKGEVTTSAPVTWTVNAAPSVALTGPAAGASFVAPARVTLTAAATDTDGSIAKVDFLANGALIGSATTAPYSVAWETAAVGSVSLTAVATDNRGATSTSGAVAITLAANQAPAVALTSPTAGQGFTAPATVTLTASATDADGSIAQVAFYGNDTLLGTVTTAPYSLTWANLAAGSYTVTVLATDDHGGVTTSAPLTVTVGPTPTRIVYLHADHLGTPRLATDSNGTVVWRHDPLTEPFGNAPPEEDPDGDGVPFTLNLRFPGQYFDAETNLAYNYFRDYDPQTGRYIQSDPIGLAGGINTYSYVGGNPLGRRDPLGLIAVADDAVIFGGVVIVGCAMSPGCRQAISDGTMAMASWGARKFKSIARKVQDLCTPEDNDPCDEQQQREEAACSDYFGHWSYDGCMQRARIRGDMCRRNQPDPPPPWSDADVNGWAPPRAQRGNR